MGGSICYLENPYNELDEIKSLKLKFTLAVRTAFSSSADDEVSMQIVPKDIYGATYPICYYLFCIALLYKSLLFKLCFKMVGIFQISDLVKLIYGHNCFQTLFEKKVLIFPCFYFLIFFKILI